jgi:Peptidase propeptide and YPEB domain
MRKLILAAALLIAAPAFAEGIEMGTELGTTAEAVSAALTEMGWEVRKLDTEDGMIEAYAVMGDQTAEIYVDPTTGMVVKVGGND